MLPTKRLFDEDAYLTEFEAEVLSCTETENGFDMVFDQTAFFPDHIQQCGLSATGTAGNSNNHSSSSASTM